MPRSDPYQGYLYVVEVEGLTVGGFSRVKGLTREIKFETYHEGGVNDFEHKLATLASFGNLILERGLADVGLWEWQDQVTAGNVRRRKITVALRDQAGKEVRRWHADGAFPVRYSASDFDAAASAIIVESVEFAHHGLRTS